MVAEVIGVRTRRSYRHLAPLKARLGVELLEDRTAPALVAAYAFNEGTGTTVTDASGNGNTGTLDAATWTTAGKYGNALSFNGTSSMVTIPDAASLHLTTGMTLEAWVNPSVVSKTWRDVIYKGNDNYYLSATSSTSSRPAIGAIVNSTYVESYGTAAPKANTWAFLTGTFDGTTMRLYVNGTLVSSKAGSGSILTSTNAPANWWRQLLRPVLQGNDRRSPYLQRGPDGGADHHRHEHADRSCCSTAGGECWTERERQRGQPIQFNGTASGGTAPLTYAWTFGDGGTANTLTATHTYASDGAYTATLTVTDSASRTSTATASVTVNNVAHGHRRRAVHR